MQVSACNHDYVRQRTQQGFSLIELMIAVVIVGVVVAVAIPAYQTYATRARVSEGLALAEKLKSALSTYVAVEGRMPKTPGNNWLAVLNALGVDADSQAGAASGHAVKRIWVHSDRLHPSIRIRYQDGRIDSRLLYLVADLGKASINWRCMAPAANGVDARYLPANCR